MSYYTNWHRWLFLIMAIVVIIPCVGQTVDVRFRQMLDSLDSIHPKSMFVPKNLVKSYKISIKNQQQFDQIEERLHKAIKEGYKNIIVEVGKGTYYYKENHISLTNMLYDDVSIAIKGKNAILISAGTSYRQGDEYKGVFNHATTFVDTKTLKVDDYWDDAVFSDSLIEVVDEKKKLCRIPCSVFDLFDGVNVGDKYVSVTQWYLNKTYKVTNIDHNGVYFIADDLRFVKNFGREGWSVNYDFIYGKQNPRFRLCNLSNETKCVYVSKGHVKGRFHEIHECLASCFLLLNNVHFSSFEITGFHFVGNKSGGQLMRFKHVQTGVCRVSKCIFDAIRGSVVYADESQNIEFLNNKIIDCYDYGVRIANGCSNIRITSNHFENSGLNMKNTFCITSAAEDYYIAHNTFKNFGYGAIGVGVWHGSEKKYVSSGIIEHNEMWYTSDYFLNKEKHTIMDSGAIYLWTQNDDAIIRYNYIHDYTGMEQNRGVFCDDGASNFRIYGNVIINTPTSYCIDSRKVSDLVEDGFLNNRNNLIMYNVVDGAINFVGREETANLCKKGVNYILCSKGDSVYCNYLNINVEEADSQIDCTSSSSKRIKIRNRDRMEIKRMPCWHVVKQYVKRYSSF